MEVQFKVNPKLKPINNDNECNCCCDDETDLFKFLSKHHEKMMEEWKNVSDKDAKLANY